MVTDQDLASYFKVGDKLPLVDFIRDKALDESTECMLGQIPKDTRIKKAVIRLPCKMRQKNFGALKK